MSLDLRVMSVWCHFCDAMYMWCTFIYPLPMHMWYLYPLMISTRVTSLSYIWFLIPLHVRTSHMFTYSFHYIMWYPPYHSDPLLPWIPFTTSSWALPGFHLLGIFPPKTFIVKLNNNCIKYLVYAFIALSSAVLYCILVKHELSQKYTHKSFHAAAGGGSPPAMAPPKQKILDETLITTCYGEW